MVKTNTLSIRYLGQTKMLILVVGAGIQGLCTCFYLLGKTSEKIILLEASVEGHAGGFLARDWHQEPVASLAKESFRMHTRSWLKNGMAPSFWGIIGRWTLLKFFKDGKREKSESSDGTGGLKKLSWLRVELTDWRIRSWGHDRGTGQS
jgi:glycine/D-amino acid oxidase-like deaminating enzyme